jgi:hypothetical protein
MRFVSIVGENVRRIRSEDFLEGRSMDNNVVEKVLRGILR